MTVSYVTYAQLLEDVQLLLQRIPAETLRTIKSVVGIARSGLLPATIIATQLHLPLISTTRWGGITLGAGKRLGEQKALAPRLIVDDSVFAGTAMREAVKFFRTQPHYRAALYVCPDHLDEVDFYARAVPRPRYFEWNLLQHPDLSHFMLDIDGILCHDPQPFDDDGETYQRALINALPFRLPKRPVLALCSNRLERWRDITRAWLEQHGVEYAELCLSPYATAAERRAGAKYGEFKAKCYRASAATLFVESCPKQAAVIARLSGKPVICPSHPEAFNPPPADESSGASDALSQ